MPSLSTPVPTLHRLLRRFGSAATANEITTTSVSLASALGTKVNPLHVLAYMAGLGITVASLDDLLLVNDLADEEELSAHRVAEGVAVTVASQDEWLLFRP